MKPASRDGMIIFLALVALTAGALAFRACGEILSFSATLNNLGN